MKRSLKERLAPLDQEREPCTIKREPLGQFFREVGRMTHLAYPVRRLKQIGEDSQVPEDRSYERALALARRDAASEEWQEEGERLMDQLLIEPFAAIHEMLKEDGTHDDV